MMKDMNIKNPRRTRHSTLDDLKEIHIETHYNQNMSL